MGITDEKLAELRRIAEAATPGPWKAGIGDRSVSAAGSVDTADCVVWGTILWAEKTSQTDGEGRSFTTNGTAKDNRDYVLAFDPPTVLALMERVRKAETALRPLAAKEVPVKPTGNAGAYSLLYSEIIAARAALTGES